jgi:hypothetical protein
MEGGLMSHNPSLYSSLVAVADESIANLDAHAVAGKLVQGTIGRSAATFLRRQGEPDTSRLDALRDATIEITNPDEADVIVLAAHFTGRVYLGFFDE